MARVIIDNDLKQTVKKKFKQESKTIFRLMQEFEKSPKKGKHLATINDIAIRELKYKSFRFFCITDAYAIKFLDLQELHNLIIKFVRMSDKKKQQQTIEEIKEALRKI